MLTHVHAAAAAIVVLSIKFPRLRQSTNLHMYEGRPVCTCVEEVCGELMVRLSVRGIIEERHGGVAHVVLNVLGGMVEADIVKATSAAQRAAIHVVFPPLQPCSKMQLGRPVLCTKDNITIICTNTGICYRLYVAI